jgi:hypothetical protein
MGLSLALPTGGGSLYRFTLPCALAGPRSLAFRLRQRRPGTKQKARRTRATRRQAPARTTWRGTPTRQGTPTPPLSLLSPTALNKLI